LRHGGPWQAPASWRPSVIACSGVQRITIRNLINRLRLIQIMDFLYCAIRPFGLYLPVLAVF
jgi:hypothetical protein